MRGKRLCEIGNISNFRITPADAGKTPNGCRKQQPNRDHPRGCGENAWSRPLPLRSVGSPPRMRGKPPSVTSVYLPPGITPADAGKTKCWKFLLDDNTDHPRGCGENISDALDILKQIGSPPRMRGKRNHYINLRLIYRITPADAGKTNAVFSVPDSQHGSPPRMRGKLTALRRLGGFFRDHPRGCGENRRCSSNHKAA